VTVYRLVRSKYADLSGKGASDTGGRCNRRGIRAVYTSENIALTVLDVLVHVGRQGIPEDYVTTAIDLPSHVPVMDYSTADLAKTAADLGQCPAIRVPSVIVPREHNFVLYPDVAGFDATVLWIDMFYFDQRLFVR
jgi:RES domain-containing protein